MSCFGPSCDRGAYGHGLCKAHYRQWASRAIETGTPGVYVGFLTTLGDRHDPPQRLVLETAFTACDEDACPRVSIARGLCQAHYNQRRVGIPLRPLAPLRSL